ncbi:reverse transcriptase domain-containing protein [Tanacetum coccineum]
MVKKHEGSWRMCVDFTDLNKVCPQDCYPLPEIDWKVESLCGYPFKCFLDAYKGYHQIQMAETDEEKTAFHTSQMVYCYTKMPFGLKNAGAMYQRLVDKAFDSQVGRNIEVYVDDLVIKSYTETEMLRDIEETFRTLRKINMKLNLKKCTFGAVEGMFLGYTITPEGIKPCSDKTKAVLQLPSPRTIKKVQSLKGKLAKRLPLDIRSGTSLQATKTTFVRATLAGSTQTERRIDCIPVPLLWSWPRAKLYSNVKASSITSFCRQKVAEILADFLVEKPDDHTPDTSVVETPLESWTLFTDGSSCVDRSGAEYDALIAGLRIAAQMGVRNVQVSVDSKLVANQELGTYVAKEQNMIKYLEKVKGLVSGFASFSISQVPRSKNKKADALSKIASTSFEHLSKQVLVETLKEKSIHEEEVATVVEEDGITWMTPIIEYLKDGTLPGDRKEASKLRIKARQYELLEGILYKRMHGRPRSVVAKAMRLGYYLPTMHRDAREMIRTCNDCQIHRPVPRNPQHPLTPITAPWPFYKWGIDIAGPFPEGSGNIHYRSTILIPVECTTRCTSIKEYRQRTGVRPKNFKIALHPNFPDQEVAIGGTLSTKTDGTVLYPAPKEKPWIYLRGNHAVMTGVPQSGCPIRHVKKSMTVAGECGSFTTDHLTMACPQYCYHRPSLPEIDCKVQFSLLLHPIKCFLDAMYKMLSTRYQWTGVRRRKNGLTIQPEGVYCYTKMGPSAQEVRYATYQRSGGQSFDIAKLETEHEVICYD